MYEKGAGMITNAEDLVGRTIAGYRLLQVLGRGGMSAVFLAERWDPSSWTPGEESKSSAQPHSSPLASDETGTQVAGTQGQRPGQERTIYDEETQRQAAPGYSRSDPLRSSGGGAETPGAEGAPRDRSATQPKHV